MFVIGGGVAIKPTYIDLPEDLKRQIKASAAERGMHFKDLVADVLRDWLASNTADAEELRRKSGSEAGYSGGIANSSSPVLTGSTEHPDVAWLVEMAGRILRSDSIAADALAANVITFHTVLGGSESSAARNATEQAEIERIRASNKRIRAIIERKLAELARPHKAV